VDPVGNISPYVSTPFDYNLAGPQHSMTDLRYAMTQKDQINTATGENKDPGLGVLRSIAIKLFRTNVSTLKMCAFLEDESALFSIMVALRDTDMDLRSFFGGLPMYHNSRELMRLGAGGADTQGMPTQFEGAQTAKADPFMVIRRTNSSRCEWAMGFRAWDMLLLCSLMRRPRRDYGIVTDFARSLTEYMCGMVPASILPYREVLSCRLDPFTWNQMTMKLPEVEARPTVMLRFRDSRCCGSGARFSYPSPGLTGLMEDDSHMAAIITFADKMQMDDFTQVKRFDS
jgi:hypothetical protein